MKANSILSVFIISILAFAFSLDARQGCCSHHGGVCGCGCCDGTGLSSKCAPYYPECNEQPKKEYQDTNGLSSIKTYQIYLKKLGYYTESINGVNDSTTQDAISRFQEDHELDVNGNLDDTTKAVIKKAYEESQ